MMGGSLASSIKKNKLARNVYAFDSNKRSLSYAKKHKLIDDFDDSNFRLMSKSEFIIICSPVDCYDEIFKIVNDYSNEEAIITDIGSVKTNIVKSLKKVSKIMQNNFLGSHPLTGSEKCGIKNLHKNLYDDQYVLLTKYNLNTRLFNKINLFWKKIGCKTLLISAKEHDMLLSITSHLPHIVSFVLVKKILSKCKSKDIKYFTGGGFRDFARLAHSDSHMWEAIISNNRDNINKSIDNFISELTSFKKIIKSNKSIKIRNYINSIQKKIN